MEYKKGKMPTWKDTLDGNKQYMLDMSKIVQMARDLRYPLLSWNGRIYELTEDSYCDTGYLSKELE